MQDHEAVDVSLESTAEGGTQATPERVVAHDAGDACLADSHATCDPVQSHDAVIQEESGTELSSPQCLVEVPVASPGLITSVPIHSLRQPLPQNVVVEAPSSELQHSPPPTAEGLFSPSGTRFSPPLRSPEESTRPQDETFPSRCLVEECGSSAGLETSLPVRSSTQPLSDVEVFSGEMQPSPPPTAEGVLSPSCTGFSTPLRSAPEATRRLPQRRSTPQIVCDEAALAQDETLSDVHTPLCLDANTGGGEEERVPSESGIVASKRILRRIQSDPAKMMKSCGSSFRLVRTASLPDRPSRSLGRNFLGPLDSFRLCQGDTMVSSPKAEQGIHSSMDDSGVRGQLRSGGHIVDPMTVYVRLSNFSARRLGLTRRRCSEKADRLVKEVAATNLQCQSFSEELSPMMHEPTLGDRFCDHLTLPSSRAQTPKASGQEIGHRTFKSLQMPTSSLKSRGIVGSTPPSPSMIAMLSGTTCHRLDTVSDFCGDLPQPLAGESPVRPRRSAAEPIKSDSRGESSEECEEENIAMIQNLLEEMNVAAIELNAAQEAVSWQIEEQQRLVQLWAVGSTRLVRAIGAHRLAKAAPHHECIKRCEAAQKAVQEASAQFMAAVGVDLSASDMDAITRVHAAKLDEFQAVQRELHRMRAARDYSQSSVAAAAPFFEAEEEHRTQLARVEAEISLLTHDVDSAKARYHAALRGLEALSEQAHRRKAVTLDESLGPEQSCTSSLAKDAMVSEGSMILSHASLPLLSPDITPGRTMRRKSADDRGLMASPSVSRRRGRASTMGAMFSSGRRRRKQALVAKISDGGCAVPDDRPQAS